MGKQKTTSCEEIRKKIRKLERKLEKNNQSTTNQSIKISSNVGNEVPSSPFLDNMLSGSLIDTPPYVNLEWDENNILSMCDTSPQEEVPIESVPGTSQQQNELPLDDELLKILGDAPKPECALGKPIHKDLPSRWSEILSKGLQKEVQDNLLQEYEIPENCDLLLAPLLNPVAKAALPDALVKRDSFLSYKQKQLGVALSALAETIGLIIANQTSKQLLLKPLSDACRILCNIHFSETKTRRKLVLSSVNSSIKDALIDTTRDKLLYGQDITEKLKTAQSIQRSGAILKNPPRIFQRNNNHNQNSKQNFYNTNKPHRRVDLKPARYRLAPSATAVSRTARPPPPPPPPPHRRDRSPLRKNYYRH